MISSNFNTFLPIFNKFLNPVLQEIFFFLPKPLAYCSLGFFVSAEVLAPEVLVQFREQVEIARSDVWAVGWMW
jgi:hypothetical protein